jgi:hypothetical protein
MGRSGFLSVAGKTRRSIVGNRQAVHKGFGFLAEPEEAQHGDNNHHQTNDIDQVVHS